MYIDYYVLSIQGMDWLGGIARRQCLLHQSLPSSI